MSLPPLPHLKFFLHTKPNCVSILHSEMVLRGYLNENLHGWVLDGGKMWLFEDPPSDYLEQTYGFRPDAAWFDTAIYNRLSLPVGAVVKGPAILVQPDTTVLVDPGLTAKVDTCGNTIITRDED